MYLAQSSDRLLHDAPWMKKPWGCADKLQQMFRCSTSKNLNYRWPRSFVVDLCDFPSCLRQEWKLNVDGVCHVAVLLTLLAFRFYWCVTWRSGQVLGKEGGRKEQKEKDKTAKLKAKLPCRHCMSPSHNRGIAHPGDPRLVAALAFVGVVHRITPWAELHTIFTYFRAHDRKICKMYQNVTTTSNNKIVAAHQSYHNEVPASDWQTLPIEVLHRPSPRAPPQVRADHRSVVQQKILDDLEKKRRNVQSLVMFFLPSWSAESVFWAWCASVCPSATPTAIRGTRWPTMKIAAVQIRTTGIVFAEQCAEKTAHIKYLRLQQIQDYIIATYCMHRVLFHLKSNGVLIEKRWTFLTL